MVPCAAGEPDAGAVEHADGCVWTDGDDKVDRGAGGAFVSLYTIPLFNLRCCKELFACEPITTSDSSH